MSITCKVPPVFCLLISWILPTHARFSCLEDYQYFGKTTQYETVRFKEEAPQTDSTCQQVALWAVYRHGFRYPKVKNKAEILHNIKKDILRNSKEGFLCGETLTNLTYWTMRMTPEDDWRLAPSGWREMIGIGNRLRLRYPELFREYNPEDFMIRHSNISGDMTKDSAKAWAQGIFGKYDHVALNEGETHFHDFMFLPPCTNPQPTVDQREHDMFLHSPEMTSAKLRTANLTGLPKDYFTYDKRLLSIVYDMCTYETGIYGTSPWCGILDDYVLRVHEFAEDMFWYWKDSFPNPKNYLRSCRLLEDALHSLRAMVEDRNGPKVTANFGHVPNIVSFYALLGMFKESDFLSADGFTSQQNRKFRLSLQAPMSANLVLVLTKCPSSGHFVEAFMNEEPILIPGCSRLRCLYEELVELWEPLVTTCNHDSICSISKEDELSNSSNVHLTDLSYVVFILLILLTYAI